MKCDKHKVEGCKLDDCRRSVRPLVYVAGPLTTGDQDVNVRQAIQFGDTLMDHGFVPFVPHLSVLWNMIAPRGYEDWMSYDFEVVKRCDAVFRLPGASKGADREVDLATKLEIPVFTSMAALLEARNEGRFDG